MLLCSLFLNICSSIRFSPNFPLYNFQDGQEVKKAIVFDLEEDTKSMLPSRMIFFTNEESKNIAMNFLMEYFRVYDSGNRQNLMNAYHEQASMSVTVSFQSQPQKLGKYLQENRNLFRVTDSHRRHKLLRTGRLQVVSLVDSLPKTQHIEQSFTMDVCLATVKNVFFFKKFNFILIFCNKIRNISKNDFFFRRK